MPDQLLGGIIINEVLVDPNGANNFDTDGNGSAQGRDEFLELRNISDSAIDISGVELWDAGRDNWFTFPPGTILQPGAVAVVVRDVRAPGDLPPVTGDDLAFDANFGSNVFNNARDNIVVYDPSNDEFIQATYNGDSLDDPTTGSNYAGFSSTATRVGAGEDFGTDQDGFSIQREAGTFSNSSTPTPGAQNLCFASGTLIETPSGFTPIERLTAGDLVRTMDAGFQPIRWIYYEQITAVDLAADPKLRPICVPTAHQDAPTLRLSRHHRVMIDSKAVQRMFGVSQVLVPAKDLLGQGGVFVDETSRPFAYFHVLLEGHHIVNANGIATETLLLADQSIKALSTRAVCDLATSVANPIRLRSVAPARVLASGSKARNLVMRQCKNGRSVAAPFQALPEPQVACA